MATTVLGLKTFAAADPVDYNEVNDNYNKIDNGVKTALQGRAAHNLLDNSDFRNPVNQRGITSQIGGGYGLDRWRADGSGTISVESTGISLTNLSFGQPVPLKAGTYTLAFHLSDGTTLGYVFKFDGSSTLNAINSSWHETTGAYVNYYKHSTGVVTVQIVVAEGYTIIVDWAALYEGSYDASTLPSYQPKGYAAELAECQRYFERLGGTFSQFLGNAVFAKAGAKSVIISIKYSPKRLPNPTLSFSNPSEYRILVKDAVNASTISAYSITSIDSITTETPFAFFRVNLANALTADAWMLLQRADGATGAYIDVNADL